jgi:hypothetical protein
MITGNDLIYKYANPDGCGLRVTTAKERFDAVSTLLDDPGLCDELGAAGNDNVRRFYSAANLEADLMILIRRRTAIGRLASLSNAAPSSFEEWLGELRERVQRKVLMWSSKGPATGPVTHPRTSEQCQ